MEQHEMLLFPWFCWVHSVSGFPAGDSLLSPKGNATPLINTVEIFRIDNFFLIVDCGWYWNNSGCFDVGEEGDDRDFNSVDPCTWSMVACSTEAFVVSLEMASVGLSGVLSPSIGNLSQLRTMLLQNNQLSGHIPDEIGSSQSFKVWDTTLGTHHRTKRH